MPKSANRIASNRQHDARRRQESETRPLYGTQRWRQRSAHQLLMEPLCRMCLWFGRTTAARVADHCVPHRGDVEAFWSGALQSLCAECHDGRKQNAEQRGYYELLDVDGWPLRIGLEGGFPRTGDDVAARAAAFEATPGGVKSLGPLASRPAATLQPQYREIRGGGGHHVDDAAPE